MIEYFKLGLFLVIFVDCFDVIVVVVFVVMNGVEIGVVLLIGGYDILCELVSLCKFVFDMGLFIFKV